MASQLQDKVAIITGSSSGIGESIALAFASRGAKVTLCGRDMGRLKSVFDKVVEASGGHKDRFLIVQGDLTNHSVRKDIVTKTVEKFGRLDILVANAGVTTNKGSLATATEESFDSVMDTNLKSVFFLIQESVPHLEKSKGSIINISSNLSTIIHSGSTLYSLTKAALDHLTRCLAVDLGPRGIRVNGINPGYIPTRLLRYFGPDVEKLLSGLNKTYNDQVSLKGRRGIVDDIADAAVFLASDSARFITGENIKVDGGRSFGGSFDLASTSKTD